jgi:hypothetical protein
VRLENPESHNADSAVDRLMPPTHMTSAIIGASQRRMRPQDINVVMINSLSPAHKSDKHRQLANGVRNEIVIERICSFHREKPRLFK